MKNLLLALCIILATAMGSGCSKVDPGYVGIKVNLTGSDKGVEPVVFGNGYYFVMPFTQKIYTFPTFQQNHTWTKGRTEGSPNDDSFTFQSKEGVPVNTDVGVVFSIEEKYVAKLFQRYRRGVDEIRENYIRSMIRDAFVNVASTMEISKLYGEEKTVMVKKAKDEVNAQLAESGIRVDSIFLVGTMRLPDNIRDAINKSMEANQRAEQARNEKAVAMAEADKVREKARGTADAIMTEATAQAAANEKLAKSITPALVNYEAVKKWDGVLPKVASDATPLINLDGLK